MRVNPPPDELRRGLGLSTATYVVMASMVGTGILTTSGYIVLSAGSNSLMLALWVVGGGIALCGALGVAELASAMPHAGGEYVFMREAYGPVAAFLYGWVSFVIGFSAPTAITSHLAARYLVGAFGDASGPTADLLIRAIAALIILAFTLVHLLGLGSGSRAQSLTTIAKLAVLAALAIGGLALGRGTGENIVAGSSERIPWAPLAVSLVYVMFSYSGWNAATYLAGEVRDAPRTLPRALLLGCGSVLVLYVLLNVTYAYALSPADVAGLRDVEGIAAIAAERLFGPWVSHPLSAAIGIGLLATVSAFILAGPRIYYAMARDGLFPSAGGRLTSSGVPATAIVSQSVCALVLLLSGTFQSKLFYAGLGLAISSFFVILAVIVLRIRRPDMLRPFRVPGYPLVPLLFMLCTAWMIVHSCRSEPQWSAITIGSILAGVPLYFAWTALRRRRPMPPR